MVNKQQVYDLAQKSLDALWLRQKVITNNIANLDTPGYTAKRVEFENILSQIIRDETDTRKMGEKIAAADPVIWETEDSPIREDGNNVDIDRENLELVRTQLQYEYMIRMISDNISREKYVINEGRR